MSLNQMNVKARRRCSSGVVGLTNPKLRCGRKIFSFRGTTLERSAKESNSPVLEKGKNLLLVKPDYHRTREIWWEAGRITFQG